MAYGHVGGNALGDLERHAGTLESGGRVSLAGSCEERRRKSLPFPRLAFLEEVTEAAGKVSQYGTAV